VDAGELKRKENSKNRYLRHKEREENGKLLVQLTSPQDDRHRRLQDRLSAPQIKDDGYGRAKSWDIGEDAIRASTLTHILKQMPCGVNLLR
jgi:hypothetical protein